MTFSAAELRVFQEDIMALLRPMRNELLQSYGSALHQTKPDKSVVTVLDEKVESSLKEHLAGLYPDIGFKGEETGQSGATDTYWLVDPIDGTEHFVRGFPLCSNMVTLVQHGQPIVAVIYDFVQDVTYKAALGCGSFRNEEKLQVSSLLADNRMMFMAEINTQSSDGKDFSHRLHDASDWIMSFATGGMSYVPVVAGMYEGRVSYNSWANDFDMAPGVLLVKEAGGIVVPMDKSDYDVSCVDLYMGSQQGYDFLASKGVFN